MVEADGAERDALEAARSALIAKLDGQHYRPLVAWILRPMASVGRRSFRREPYPSWLATLVLVPLILALGYIVGRLAGEAEVFGERGELVVGVAVVSAGMGLCTELLTRMLQISLAEDVVPNIGATADLSVIESSLDRIFDPRRQLAFTLLAGAGLFGTMLWSVRGSPHLHGLGLSVVGFLLCTLSASALYFSAPMLGFLPRLGRLELEIYQANPRDSQVLISLVGTTNRVLYIFSALCALISILAARHGLLRDPGLEFSLLGTLWIPITVSFIGAHTTFRAIIVRSKWRYLSQLQRQIEARLNHPDFPGEGTLDTARELMAHHDEVRATPNSTVDYRAWVAYFNSILFPFIAGIMANLSQIVAWLELR